MRKYFIYILFSCFSIGHSKKSIASPQLPDYIIYKGDTLATYTLLLEQYFKMHMKSDQVELFGLSFRNGALLNCWRGYQAIYKIENDSLFLVDIISCWERDVGINKTASLGRMKAIFDSGFVNDRVYVDWFSGDLKFPLTNKVLRWDGVFYKIFETEKVITISNGTMVAIEDVRNYVDDPHRINRRDKAKVSMILFKNLKKNKWKNKEDFDCSEKYGVTIDEHGNISKVRMLYSDSELDQY